MDANIGAGAEIATGRRRSGSRRGAMQLVARSILTTAATLLLVSSLTPIEAAAAPNEHEHPDGKGSMGEIGQKLSNPTSDVWAMYTEFDFAFYGGTATGGSGDKTSQAMIFQPIMPIELTKRFKVLTRPTLPVIMNQDVPQGGGGFNNFGGLGDLSLPLLLAQEAPLFELGGGAFVGALGPAFTFPTSTNDAFGNQQWEVGLSALALWKNSKITMGVFPEWFWGVGWRKSSPQTGPSSNHGELEYFFYYELGNAWQVGFNPVMTFNPEAAPGNKANVPIGLLIAKTLKLGNTPMKMQLGVEYSVVAQNLYGKRTMIKLNLIPVIQPLIKKPLFSR